MANADAPMGFKPKYQLDGSPYNGGTVKCAILAADSTATFIGDLVTLSGSASAEGYPSVQQGAASDTDFFGVVTSFDADPATSLEDQYRKASTLRTCNVVPALDVVFEVQCSGAFAITDVGNTADVTVGTGDTITGISAMELNSADIGTGVNLHIVGFDQRPDNEIDTNANVLVRINESAFRGANAAAGV